MASNCRKSSAGWHFGKMVNARSRDKMDRMAKCDEGYLCEICGEAVESLTDSALYLQYVVGWIDPETLHTRPDSHLLCLPSLAQFVEHESFPVVRVEGDFDRRKLDEDFVAERVALLSRGYRRLSQIQSKRKGLAVMDYPLPEAIAKWQDGS